MWKRNLAADKRESIWLANVVLMWGLSQVTWGSSRGLQQEAALTVTAGVSLGRLCLLHTKEVALKAMSGQRPHIDWQLCKVLGPQGLSCVFPHLLWCPGNFGQKLQGPSWNQGNIKKGTKKENAHLRGKEGKEVGKKKKITLCHFS